MVIRGGQIRPTSSNPEDYVVHDVMLWDPLSFFFRIWPQVVLIALNILEWLSHLELQDERTAEQNVMNYAFMV